MNMLIKKSFLDFEILRGIHQAIVKMMINWYKTIFNSYIKGWSMTFVNNKVND